VLGTVEGAAKFCIDLVSINGNNFSTLLPAAVLIGTTRPDLTSITASRSGAGVKSSPARFLAKDSATALGSGVSHSASCG
jgi:hypothetical protein